MNIRRPAPELTRFPDVDAALTEILQPAEERSLLQELGECKRKLTERVGRHPGRGDGTLRR